MIIDIAEVSRKLITKSYPHNPKIQNQILDGARDFEFDVYYTILGARAMVDALRQIGAIAEDVKIVDNSKLLDDILK